MNELYENYKERILPKLSELHRKYITSDIIRQATKEVFNNYNLPDYMLLNLITTRSTEIVGDRLLVKYNILEQLFNNPVDKEPKPYQITDVRLQKQGIDYILSWPNSKHTENWQQLFIDVKTNVHNKIVYPIAEKYQNNKLTHTDDKLTDFLVYILIDNDGIRIKVYHYSIISDYINNISDDELTTTRNRSGKIAYIKGVRPYKEAFIENNELIIINV